MQDRLTYANGNTITTEGFRCSIGEPIDIKVTVGESEEVELHYAAAKRINRGNYFITLEVNGEKAAYRDLYHLGEDAVTIGDYTISDDLYLTGLSENDEVVMRLEPIELTVTDEFRAAVGAVVPKSKGGSGGGGTGGGVLVVHVDEHGTLDHTWQEIMDAVVTTGAAIVTGSGNDVSVASTVTDCILTPEGYAVITKPGVFVATFPTDYPAVDNNGGGGSGPLA